MRGGITLIWDEKWKWWGTKISLDTGFKTDAVSWSGFFNKYTCVTNI